jgi:hypothetical protein
MQNTEGTQKGGDAQTVKTPQNKNFIPRLGGEK